MNTLFAVAIVCRWQIEGINIRVKSPALTIPAAQEQELTVFFTSLQLGSNFSASAVHVPLHFALTSLTPSQFHNYFDIHEGICFLVLFTVPLISSFYFLLFVVFRSARVPGSPFSLAILRWSSFLGWSFPARLRHSSISSPLRSSLLIKLSSNFYWYFVISIN